jgi:BolA protein
MKNYLKYIETKIKENLKIENLNIIDNTSKHKTHKFFDNNKYHLCLEIESNYLKNMKRIDAQRVLFTILKEEMNTKIHALEIKIK